MATQIKFGTCGWRAVMAKEFTFANVRRAVNGIARHVSHKGGSKKKDGKVIVGRDPRFLGETLCAMAADILSSYGITPLVIAKPAPTPAISTANLINAIAEKHKIELHETPVSFKYIGELIKQDKILIGGEESAGLSIRKHVPEKNGVLAGLLCCEMVARRGTSLGKQLKDLFAKVGSFYPLRENFRLTPEVKEKFTEKLRRRDPTEFNGMKVASAVRTDGLKLLLADGSWVCYRLSGTEPVVRVYSEACSEEALRTLSAAAKAWIFA